MTDEEKEVLIGFLIGSISILRDMHIQFTEKSRNKLADKIMELLTDYEKQQKEIELLKEENEKYKNPPFFDEDKYTENDKIKAKIEEVQKMKAKAKDIVFKSSLNYIETELKSILEKE